MNDDALAAVAAAARLLFARDDVDATSAVQSRWNIAGRLRIGEVVRARLVTRAPSRWTMSGRLRD